MGTQPWSFCSFFKITHFLPIAKRRLAISDIRSIYFYLRKNSSSLPTPSCLATPPSPLLCPPPGLLEVRAQQNLFRHMEKKPRVKMKISQAWVFSAVLLRHCLGFSPFSSWVPQGTTFHIYLSSFHCPILGTAPAFGLIFFVWRKW